MGTGDVVKNQELLAQLKGRFEELKLHLGFKTSLEELDKIFYIKDAILSAGFIADNLGRQVCGRIQDTFMGWNNYLHNLIMPDPHSMIQMNESKLLNEEDKKDILKIIAASMKFVSMNLVIGTNGDKNMERDFIDESLIFWNSNYKIGAERIARKIYEGWGR